MREKLPFALLPFALIGSAHAQDKKADQKPNIIFLITDDQRWDAIGYANNLVHTPYIDSLATNGVIFNNTFCTTPISAASRASLLTGMYERTHGYTFGTGDLKKELSSASYPYLLKSAGYYTGLVGKMGVGFEDKSFTETVFNIYKTYNSDHYFRLVNGEYGHRHITDIDGDNAVQFIESAPNNQPFFLCVGFNAAHAEDSSPQQYIWSEGSNHLYNNITIPPPVLGEPHWFDELPEFVQNGLNRKRWGWRFDTEEKYQRMVKGHYRMISDIDRQVGRIMRVLEEKGMADNTIIIFIGDNGYFLGERGLAGKWLLYENSIRVPFFIYNPTDKDFKRKKSDALVLNIDVAPTILALAGIKAPKIMQGQSVTDLMKNKNTKWRDMFFCEHLFDRSDIPQSEGIRTTDWKYFRYRNYPDYEELYYISDDPMEKNNLVKSKSHQSTLEKLRKQTDEMIEILIKQRIK